MRAVRRERTTPEEAVASFLRSQGIRYRRNVRSLPGSPDFANITRGFAILVHGCFWHRHPGCRRATTPRANAAFWAGKFEANVERDERTERNLRSSGLRVVTIWECEAATRDEIATALRGLLDALGSESSKEMLP